MSPFFSSGATASQAESPCYPNPDNFLSPQTTFSCFQTCFETCFPLNKWKMVLLLLTNSKIQNPDSPHIKMGSGAGSWHAHHGAPQCKIKLNAGKKSFAQPYCLLIFIGKKKEKRKERHMRYSHITAWITRVQIFLKEDMPKFCRIGNPFYICNML